MIKITVKNLTGEKIMRNLKKILESRYLNIREYYGLALKLTEKIFKENRIWIFYFLVLAFAASVDDVFTLLVGLKNTEWIISMSLVLILSVSYILFYRKVVYKIEGKEKSEIKKVFFKAVIWGIVEVSAINLYTNDYFKNKIPDIIPFLAGIMCVVIYFSFLYFKVLYISRNIRLKDTIEYSFYLGKGNRMRMFFPLFLSEILFLQIYLWLDFLLKASVENKILILLGAFILTVFQTIFKILNVALEDVIYLNVEYMDRKKMSNIEDVRGQQ